MTEEQEKYLQNKLDSKTSDSMKSSLSDEEKKELAFEIGVGEAVKSELRSELREKVGAFEKSIDTKSGRKNYAWLAVAASVVLLLSFVFLFRSSPGDPFNDFYESYPNYEVTTLRGEEELDLIERAYQAYDLKKYEEAEELFTELLGSEENLPAQFFRGMSRIEIQKYDLALADLQVLIFSDSEYSDDATWYSALLLVRAGESIKAKELLAQLADSEDYKQKAERLLEAIGGN